jgi:hypothetical protein
VPGLAGQGSLRRGGRLSAAASISNVKPGLRHIIGSVTYAEPSSHASNAQFIATVLQNPS